MNDTFPRGVSGVFVSSGKVSIKVGPVLASNSFGLVFVEILEDVALFGRFKYEKGQNVWINPSRISWNEGKSS